MLKRIDENAYNRAEDKRVNSLDSIKKQTDVQLEAIGMEDDVASTTAIGLLITQQITQKIDRELTDSVLKAKGLLPLLNKQWEI